MSNLYQLGSNDFLKGLRVAVFTGAFMPIWAAINTPGFNYLAVNWHSVLNLAINGGIVGFAGYLATKFLSDDQSRLFGKI